MSPSTSRSPPTPRSSAGPGVWGVFLAPCGCPGKAARSGPANAARGAPPSTPACSSSSASASSSAHSSGVVRAPRNTSSHRCGRGSAHAAIVRGARERGNVPRLRPRAAACGQSGSAARGAVDQRPSRRQRVRGARSPRAVRMTVVASGSLTASISPCDLIYSCKLGASGSSLRCRQRASLTPRPKCEGVLLPTPPTRRFCEQGQGGEQLKLEGSPPGSHNARPVKQSEHAAGGENFQLHTTRWPRWRVGSSAAGRAPFAGVIRGGVCRPRRDQHASLGLPYAARQTDF